MGSREVVLENVAGEDWGGGGELGREGGKKGEESCNGQKGKVQEGGRRLMDRGKGEKVRGRRGDKRGGRQRDKVIV